MRKLVLVGAGEFTPAMDDTDRYLLSLLEAEGRPRTVAILPTAAGRESDYAKWIDRGVAYFAGLQAQAVGVPVLDAADAGEPALADRVREAAFTYFSGGDPGYLCQALQCEALAHTPVWQAVAAGYRDGKVLAGCSAGAMLMGSHMLANAEAAFEEGQQPEYTPAMGLVDYIVFPHYDAAQRDAPDVLLRLLGGLPAGLRHRVLGIDEDTALVLFDEHDARVMGRGQVHLFIGGSEQNYGPGSSFILP